MKLKGIFSIIALVILFGIMALFAYRESKPQDIRQSILSTIKKCKTSTKTLNSLDPDCVFNNFEKTITPDNLGEAVGVMQEIFTSVSDARELGITTCHIPAHIAGEVAYEKGATFNQVLKVCGQACSSGCLHGAFQGMFKESGVNLIENLSSACSVLKSPDDEDIRACWHIVGHGVGEYYGLDIQSSIKACADLPQEKQRWHCMSGLRMEHVIPSPRNSETLPQASIDDYLALCEKFPNEEGYRDDCFSEAAYAINKLFADETLAIEVCGRVPDDPIVKKRCAGGGGLIFFLAHKEDPATIFDFCNRYEEKGMVQDCLIGAVENIAVGGGKYEETIHSLCRMSGEDFLPECFSFMGEILERHIGKDFRESECAKLSAEEESYCLAEPLDPRTYYLPPN